MPDFKAGLLALATMGELAAHKGFERSKVSTSATRSVEELNVLSPRELHEADDLCHERKVLLGLLNKTNEEIQENEIECSVEHKDGSWSNMGVSGKTCDSGWSTYWLGAAVVVGASGKCVIDRCRTDKKTPDTDKENRSIIDSCGESIIDSCGSILPCSQIPAELRFLELLDKVMRVKIDKGKITDEAIQDLQDCLDTFPKEHLNEIINIIQEKLRSRHYRILDEHNRSCPRRFIVKMCRTITCSDYSENYGITEIKDQIKDLLQKALKSRQGGEFL
tara:strand:- start:193 stop:1023 length:831 start_codon:yes stop_codon:yes gene_type:complete